MRKKQETLVLFPETVTITRKFSDAQFGTLMRAAFSYRFSGEVYSGDDSAVDVAFQAIAGQIDRYQEFCRKQANNAKGSEGQPSAANERQTQPQESESAPSDPPYPYPCPSPYPYPIQESKADKPPTHPRFSPPSVKDVAVYCQEKGFMIDPERFVDYYSSVGWKVGRNPMKDWKAAVRTWVRKASPLPATPESKNCGYVLASQEDPWETAVKQQGANYV